MISVPLTSVLYLLAISSFLSCAYYGFRLSRITSKFKTAIMMTREGPISIFRGVIFLSIALILKLIESLSSVSYSNFLDLLASIMFVISAVIFAIGFEKMYSMFNNERIRANVYRTLEDLREMDVEKEKSSDWQSLR